MSKTKTLVLAFSVLTSLAGLGVSAGTAQAQIGRDRLSIAAGDLTSALDRAEYTSFRGSGGFRRFDRFYGFDRFHRFDRFDRFGRGGRGFGWGRF
jgi:hypothetical protein